MSLRVAVWGAGGHGRVLADVVRASGHSLACFVDARPVEVPGVPSLRESDVLGCIAATGGLPEGIDAVGVGIGRASARARLLGLLDGLAMPPLVHPSATVSPSASLGRGAVVFPGAVVNAEARIGDGVIINSRAVVEHGCSVADFAHVAPGAVLCGDVAVGAQAWIGAGAVVIQRLRVGRGATVGAGSIVIREVPEYAVVVGNPARVVRQGSG